MLLRSDMQRNSSSKNPALQWPASELKRIRKENNEKKIKRERGKAIISLPFLTRGCIPVVLVIFALRLFLADITISRDSFT